MEPKKVLFICVHNSARSQMAEELLRKYAGEKVVTESAGLEPGKLNPLAVEVLKEEGIDISAKETRSVFDLHKQGKKYNYVITVCSKEAEERCPIFPGASRRANWALPDPSKFEGSWTEKLEKTRAVKEEIRTRVLELLKEMEI